MVAACPLLVVILLTLGLLQVLPSAPDRYPPRSSASEDARSSAHSYAGDAARMLNAWLSTGGSGASWALREARTRTATPPPRAHCDATALLLLALGTVLVVCSPRHSAVGLRWARALRGPPARSLAR